MEITINIKKLLEESLEDFTKSSANPLETMTKISLLEKKKHEREAKKLMGKLQDRLLPLNLRSKKALSPSEKNELQKALMDFATESDKKMVFFDDSFFTYFINHGYLKSTEDFFNFVKRKDEKMPLEDFFQALRNIFIANSLSLLYGHAVGLNPALASYSLLYPYSDNYLDDPNISITDKKAFNKRFLSWLEGDHDNLPKNSNEEKIHGCIKTIEQEFPRHKYPIIYESLLHIYDAQVSSMSQEGVVKLSPHILLPISFFKGGASVVSDACLTKEEVTYPMIHFAFIYGTFLQLIDDLQDYEQDREHHHWTLFSIKNQEEIHDLEISKLISYLSSSIHKIQFHTKEEEKLKKIIFDACLMMIFSVVGKNPNLVSSKFYKVLESISRFKLCFYQELEETMASFNPMASSTLTVEKLEWF